MFQVQIELNRDIKTPAALNAKPEVQRANIPLSEFTRTEFANVRITPDITDRIICTHHDIHEQREN